MKRKLLTILLVVVAMVVIAIAVALLVPTGSPRPVARTIPSPNGYQTLLDAAWQTVGSPAGPAEMTETELRLFVADNSNALHIARVALEQESLVPWQPTIEYQSNHIADLGQLKRLAQTLSAEGRLAENERRWMDAAEIYLLMVDLGSTISRGGMVIDGLVGIAVETMGVNELRAIAGSLTNAADCRINCGRLLELDSQRPRWSEIIAFEHEWRREAYPGLGFRIAMIATRKTLRETETRTEEKYRLSQKKLREVALEFAIRAYELEHGKRPGSAADLVPSYLKSVPADPATGQELALPF